MAERLQIRFEFNTIEDRLLLRISEKGNNSCVEYRFWLTRRFVRIFIKAMDKLIEEELASDLKVSPDALEAMKKFQHEAALSKADFTTNYGEDTENCSMFNDTPLLVSTLKIKKKARGKFILSFLSNNNTGLHLTASIDLIHSLQKMLFDSVKSAAWNLPLFQTVEAEQNIPDQSAKLVS